MSATVADRIQIHQTLYDFVNQEAIPHTGIDERKFWNGFAALVTRLAPRNAALLARRDELQSKMDAWHRQHPGVNFDHPSYKAFLVQIGYLVPETARFAIDTANVDRGKSPRLPGPQLVVPVNNARYALNAANARWGSLYDALYGTDVISEDGGATRAGGIQPAARRQGHCLRARLPGRTFCARRRVTSRRGGLPGWLPRTRRRAAGAGL